MNKKIKNLGKRSENPLLSNKKSQQKDFALILLHNSKYASVLKKLASATF